MKELVITEIAKAKGGARQKAALFAAPASAGFPVPADDFVDRSLDLNELVVKHPSATFFVRVQGNSMEGAGIFSGDVLVVDRSIVPADGAIVVAAVYGELTVKRLRKKGARHLLVPANEAYEPIAVSDNEDCFIWGTVVGSVRTF